MAITSPDVVAKDKDIENAITNAKGKVEGIVGETAKKLSGFKIDFIGMKTEHLDDFKTAVQKYREDTKEIINVFNPDASMQNAVKGKVSDSIKEFLTSMKTLMQTYVQAIDLEIKNIDEAATQYTQGIGTISSSVDSDAGSIRGEAGSISLD